MCCDFNLHSNENNDIITAKIPPSVVANTSLMLNSESSSSLATPIIRAALTPITE